MDREKLRTGVELVLTLQLALEIMDEYNLSGKVKNFAKMFKNELERDVSKAYDRIYAVDPTIVTNGINIKHRLISQFAALGEDDAMLVAQKMSEMIDNIDELRNEPVYVVDINSDLSNDIQ